MLDIAAAAATPCPLPEAEEAGDEWENGNGERHHVPRQTHPTGQATQHGPTFHQEHSMALFQEVHFRGPGITQFWLFSVSLLGG
jgi:hypothetical protein